MYIIYDFYKCFNFLIIFLIFKFSFHCLLIIKYNFILSLISNVLVFKRPFFISINIFSIVFSLTLNLHFVFKKSLIFLINVVIIMFIYFLFINIIIYFFSLIFS